MSHQLRPNQLHHRDDPVVWELQENDAAVEERVAEMSVLDFSAFDAAPLHGVPCDYIVVPQFVRPDALKRINADYPAITKPGNFPLDGFSYGPAFSELVTVLAGPEMRSHVAAKFGLSLDGYPTQMTIRRFMAPWDGHIHNDSRSKKITVLIYFNEDWQQKGGQLRLLRSPDDLESYYVEVPPIRGTLFAFRRNDYSYHGFPPGEGERRVLQMYWVNPKRKLKKKATGVRMTIRKALKRTFDPRLR